MALAKLPPISSPKPPDITSRRMVKYEGLSGPNYVLGNNPLQYNLPSPRVLKPYQDTTAGTLETWPAHATGQTQSGPTAQLNRNKQLVLVHNDGADLVPKPGFLTQLETFLKKELRSLGVDKVEPNELRLQAYREVFEYLIEDFKTYKPILAAVKNEYEMMLAHQREQIRQMEPLKQMLVTVSEQCDQKIMALRDTEKQDMIDMKNENKRLYKRVDEMRQNQLSLESQVEKMQEELAAEYLKYRDECDARRLLVSDMNELRNQQEDLLLSQKVPTEDEEKDDPITLKIALKKAREDEAAATKRLNIMIADYGDVIPRRDFDQLSKDHESLNNDHAQTMADYKKLKEEHEILLEQYKLVLQQRDDFFTELESRKQNTTPRPQWDRCSDVISGGVLRWMELSEGKSSAQLMELLLHEISGETGDAGGAELFDGQGTSEEIPMYLRHEGQVRNRRLGKRDLLLLVKDIWREKTVYDAEPLDLHGNEKLSSFLHIYLQRRFGSGQLMAVEWAYNLHDACQRYLHEEHIQLFWQVLSEEADQELYVYQLQLMSKLLKHLTNVDMEQGNTGELSKDEFQKQLQEFFPRREEESILMLMTAAETELSSHNLLSIDYQGLFMEDDEGKTGPFLDEFRMQIRKDRMDFLEEIQKELGTTSPVTPEELKRAFLAVDSGLDAKILEKFLCWGFLVNEPDQLVEVESLDQSLLMERLQCGHIIRSAKK